MFQDEGRFGRISDLRRCWAPSGTRPMVPRQVVRESVYVFAAIAPISGRLVWSVAPKANSEAMSEFLQLVARRLPAHRILMVLDGAGWHKSREVVWPKSIEPYYLPPYSPELNPVEHLWEEVREKWFANRLFKTLGAVVDQLNTAMDEMTCSRPLIQDLAAFDWIKLLYL